MIGRLDGKGREMLVNAVDVINIDVNESYQDAMLSKY